MRVISINTNGIRAAARKGFFNWLPRQRADFICVQETKAQIDQLTGQALRVETLVGLLDMERADGVPRTAEELNEQAAMHYGSRAGSERPPIVTEGQLDAIRRLRDELFSRWAAVPFGETLELEFDVSVD